MRTPKTKTLLIVAAVLFGLAAISIPTFYPAPIQCWDQMALLY
jgi:hypothetical protein